MSRTGAGDSRNRNAVVGQMIATVFDLAIAAIPAFEINSQ
jgi:hypothetical protein